MFTINVHFIFVSMIVSIYVFNKVSGTVYPREYGKIKIFDYKGEGSLLMWRMQLYNYSGTCYVNLFILKQCLDK